MKFSLLKISQIIREKEKREKRKRIITWGEGVFWTIIAIVVISQGLRIFGSKKSWTEPVTAYAYTFFHPQPEPEVLSLDSIRNILDTIVNVNLNGEVQKSRVEDLLIEAYPPPKSIEEEKPVIKPQIAQATISKGEFRSKSTIEPKLLSKESEETEIITEELPQPEKISAGGENSLFNATQPSYQGGKSALTHFINSQLSYPDRAKESNVEGKVMLKLWIETDGKISRIGITEGLGYGCDEEAVRIARAMNGWIPGAKDGVQKAMWTYVTFIFSLPRNDESENS